MYAMYLFFLWAISAFREFIHLKLHTQKIVYLIRCHCHIHLLSSFIWLRRSPPNAQNKRENDKLEHSIKDVVVIFLQK